MKIGLIVAFITISFFGCQLRIMEDEMPDRITLPITVYWDLAGITPQNVTVLIYGEDGSLYTERAFENAGISATTKVSLVAGTYTIVAFNEKRNQIDYVRIRGYENLYTLEAYLTTVSSPYNTSSRVAGEAIVNQPGVLATVMKTITVSPDVINQFHLQENKSQIVENTLNSLTDLHPVNKTVNIGIKATVIGLNNARMPALSELRNIPSSYSFVSDKSSDETATIQFLMNNRAYEKGSLSDGNISTTLTSFNILGENETVENDILLDVLFQLVDKERTVVSFSNNVIKDMTVTIGTENSVSFDIDIFLGTLPNVKPEGSSESGMITELTDWDYVEIPIKL